MAVSAQNANLVWQKVAIALDSLGANSYSRDQFRALKAYLSQVKRNIDLQFVPFTEAQCDDADGTGILAGANTLYAVFVKKEDEGTDNLFFIYDSATVDTTTAEARIGLSLLAAKQEASAVYPAGLVMANGVTVTQYTTAGGLAGTDGSNGGNGFVIVGA